MDFDVFEDYPSDDDQAECELGQQDSDRESSAGEQDESSSEDADSEIGTDQVAKSSDKDEDSETADKQKREKQGKSKQDVAASDEWTSEVKAFTVIPPRFR